MIITDTTKRSRENMKHIEFYGLDIEKMNSDELTTIFDRIKEELQYWKTTYNIYPRRIHVYKSHMEMMQDKNPSTHMVITI
jgi:hypothetical protein